MDYAYGAGECLKSNETIMCISLKYDQVALHTNPFLCIYFFGTPYLYLVTKMHSEPSNPKENRDKVSRYGLWIKKLEYW